MGIRFDEESLNGIFPFRFAFDSSLRIVSFGPSLAKLLPELRDGLPLADFLRLRSPNIYLSSGAEIGSDPQRIHLFEGRGGAFTLRGQITSASETKLFHFLGSPAIRSSEEMSELGLSLSDFAAHDPTFGHLLQRRNHETAASDAKRIIEQLNREAAERDEINATSEALVQALKATGDLRIRFDRAGRLLELAVSEDLPELGIDAHASLGHTLADVIPELAAAIGEAGLADLAEGGARAFDCSIVRDDVEVHLGCRAAVTVRGEFVVVARDMTERQKLEDRLRHRALHDSMTGLPNRALLQERIGEMVRSARLRDTHNIVALLVLDLDDFKTINDELGHAAGDAVLAAVAERIQGSLRENDIAARIGGDEFAVALTELDNPALGLEIALRIRNRIVAPLYHEGHEIRPGCSIGVAITRGETEWEDLVRQADLAMYRSKADSRGGAQLFEEELQVQSQNRIQLKHELAAAIHEDQLVLHYQPIVQLESGQIAGFEALVRWQHPTRGLLFPGDFIDLAEESGLIVEIGRRVLELACAQTSEWAARYPAARSLSISVNLSPRQLRRTEIINHVIDSLYKSGLPAEQLILEITESHVVSDVADAAKMLQAFRELGARIAMDDFGTGYSSLSYLEQLPIDVLKIDKAFVDRLGVDGPSPLAEAVVAIGHSLGMIVVAEGIEMASQIDALNDLACERGQGYYFSKPLPPAEIERWLGEASPEVPRLPFAKETPPAA